MTTEEQVWDALRVIVKHQETKALNYAVNYAKYGIGMQGYELKVQCLYVLNNMTHWRGEEAKSVRGILKQFVKENKSVLR